MDELWWRFFLKKMPHFWRACVMCSNHHKSWYTVCVSSGGYILYYLSAYTQSHNPYDLNFSSFIWDFLWFVCRRLSRGYSLIKRMRRIRTWRMKMLRHKQSRAPARPRLWDEQSTLCILRDGLCFETIDRVPVCFCSSRLNPTVKKRLTSLPQRRMRMRSRSRGLREDSRSSKHRKESRSFFSQQAKSWWEPHGLRHRRALLTWSITERCTRCTRRHHQGQTQNARLTPPFTICTEVTPKSHSPTTNWSRSR